MDNSEDSKKSFFKYVFNFDDEGKSELLNILQYFLIAIIPVIILVKTVEKYAPSKEDTKSSLEISAEIIVQLIILIFGLFFINKMITFFPTFSGENYPKINFIPSILSILLVSFTFSPIVSGKINILLERLQNVWEGKPSDTKQKTKTVNVNGKQVTVKVTQPISQPSSNNNYNQSQSFNDSTSINQLPSNDSAQNYALSSQTLPNYNAMYKNQTTPLVDAATPGQMENFVQEPMAANDALGSWGGFSSW